MLEVEKKFGDSIENILDKKYIHQFKAPHEIAEEFGINRQTVYRWLDDAEIIRRDNADAQLARKKIIRPSTLELKFANHQERKPLYRIAEEVGVDKATIYKWFRKDGIEIKRGGNYPLSNWPAKEELELLYNIKKMRMRQIADKTDFCLNTLRKIFDFYDIKRRNSSEAMLSGNSRKPSEEELNFGYSTLRISPSKLAEQYHVWPKTIHRWLKEYEIKIRDSSESRLKIGAIRPEKKKMLELYIEYGIKGGAQQCGTTEKTFRRWLVKNGFILSENGFIDKKKRNIVLNEVLRKNNRNFETLTAYDFFFYNRGIRVLNWYSARYRSAPSDALNYLIKDLN